MATWANRVACRWAVVLTLVALGGAFGPWGAATTLAQSDPIGHQRLLDYVGPGLETGVGINVALVEANVGDPNEGEFRYMPNTSNSQFDGKTIIDGSGLSTGTSSHATSMGITFFGNSGSITPGISDITSYDANDWLGRVLGFNDGTVPQSQNFRVSNHSYIGTGVSEQVAVDLLQRVDFVVNENLKTTVVGVNNGSSNLLPQLLGQGYNSIAVGRSDGNHSSGLTTLYGAGRVKPDIVAPRNTTSSATALTSSVAALLHEKADNMGSATAARPEVIKAAIMAGATKEQFPSWNRTTTRPLDETFGAGQVNVFHSYRILDGGEFGGSVAQPAESAGFLGWDYQDDLAGGSSLFYELDARNLVRMDDISVLLTWNMQVEDTDPSQNFDPQTSLADLSLRLYDSTGGFLDTLIDASLSPVDNVEHLYFETLAAGLYTIEVTNESGFGSSFALAWRAQAIPEPTGGFILAIAVALVLTRRRSASRG